MKLHLKSYDGVNYKIVELWVLFETLQRLEQLEFEYKRNHHFIEVQLCWKSWETQSYGWPHGGSVHWANLSLAIGTATNAQENNTLLGCFYVSFQVDLEFYLIPKNLKHGGTHGWLQLWLIKLLKNSWEELEEKGALGDRFASFIIHTPLRTCYISDSDLWEVFYSRRSTSSTSSPSILSKMYLQGLYDLFNLCLIDILECNSQTLFLQYVWLGVCTTSSSLEKLSNTSGAPGLH